MYHDGNQSICLPYSPFVFIRCIKPIKIHLKAHKIGFHHNFKSPNCNFGPRHMDWILLGFLFNFKGFKVGAHGFYAYNPGLSLGTSGW